MKKTVLIYLQGLRDYAAGAALYMRYGSNLRYKQIFSQPETPTTKAMLIEELRKLAGLSVSDLEVLPRHMERQVPEDPVVETAPELPVDGDGIPDLTPAPETMRKMISFRDRFPFLRDPDCPDVLKVLVADMFSAFDAYRNAHAALRSMDDNVTPESAEECRKVVENYLADREIMEELVYYREHGEILGRAAIFRRQKKEEDLSRLSDMELVGKLRSAAAAVSKRKKRLSEGVDDPEERERVESALNRWRERKRLV